MEPSTPGCENQIGMSKEPADHGHHWEANPKALWIAIGVTGIVMIVEFIGGILANSLALLSDAGHMLTDMMSLVLSLIALQLALRPPSPTRTYGLYRMEILAALINGSTLILLSVYILYESYRRFSLLEAVDSSMMIGVAIIGLLANGISAWTLMPGGQKSLNIRGAYLHVLGDGISSLGVIGGGIIINYTGWYIIDPIISLAICGVILRGAILLVRDSVNILLEAVPRDVNLEEVRATILSIPGIKDVHHIHVWTITSGIHALSAHVVVGDVLTSRTTKILKEINEMLSYRYHIPHTTIQFECENCEEGMAASLNGGCMALHRLNSPKH